MRFGFAQRTPAKVLYELGNNIPSSASMDVSGTEGGYSRFSTSDMRVTFLCLDSRGEHEQGTVYTWENTLQLKHEVVQQGDHWQVELKAVPAGAEIRYTTDGSDPNSLGARYESIFSVPASSRFVQAIASKDGIQSRLEKIDMDHRRLGWSGSAIPAKTAQSWDSACAPSQPSKRETAAQNLS